MKDVTDRMLLPSGIERVEGGLVAMYLAGVSVGRVEDITEALWATRVSPSTVSELNLKIFRYMETWLNRPLEGRYPYVYVDGIWLSRRSQLETPIRFVFAAMQRLLSKSRSVGKDEFPNP